MTKVRSIAVALVFLVGCAVGGAAGRFAVPPASADQNANVQRWQYSCHDESGASDITALANKMGADGWKMIATSTWGNDQVWCFSRPLP